MRSFRLTLRALGMGVLLVAPAGLWAQRAATPVSADTLRANLFAIADDSMGGRDTGSPGNVTTADWVAAAFARYGLTPAGEHGTFFQTVPPWRIALDTTSGLDVGGAHLTPGRDVMPGGVLMTWTANGVATIYGGVADDSTTWPSAEQSAGKLVVMRPPADGSWTSLARAALAPRSAIPRCRRVCLGRPERTATRGGRVRDGRPSKHRHLDLLAGAGLAAGDREGRLDPAWRPPGHGDSRARRARRERKRGVQALSAS